MRNNPGRGLLFIALCVVLVMTTSMWSMISDYGKVYADNAVSEKTSKNINENELNKISILSEDEDDSSEDDGAGGEEEENGDDEGGEDGDGDGEDEDGEGGDEKEIPSFDSARASIELPELIYYNKPFSVKIKTGDEDIINDPKEGDTAYYCVSLALVDSNNNIIKYNDLSLTMPNDEGYIVSDLQAPCMGNYNIIAEFYPWTYKEVDGIKDWHSERDEDGNYLDKHLDKMKQQVKVCGSVYFSVSNGKFKTVGSSKTITYGSSYGTLPQMQSRKGYSFAGWYTAKTNGTKITSGSIVKVTRNTTLYGRWKYNVTLNANKGKIGKKKKANKTVTSGNKYGKFATPKRKGYNFAGWYTKKKSGTWIKKTNYVTSPNKHTLYAHWVKKTKHATKKQYKAVKKGMTYKEVKKIFGRKGIYAKSYSGKGYKNYVWFAKGNKSGAAILFVNGKVYSKKWS